MNILFVALCIIGSLGVVLRRTFLLITIQGDSMYPTLKHGDRVWARQVLFQPNPTKEDVVLIKRSFDDSIKDPFSIKRGVADDNLIVKRVVGLAGDTITIPLSDLDAIPREWLPEDLEQRADCNGDLVYFIPSSHCFVRGDGEVSVDSAVWGPVPIDSIQGVVLQ